MNTRAALNPTEGGIFASSLPAADEELIPEDEPTSAEQVREWRLRDEKISGKRPPRRLRNDAPRDAHPETLRRWGESKQGGQGDAHPTAGPSSSTHIPTHIPQQPASIPSEIEMDEEEYTDLEFDPLRLVPSRDMVFKPCDDLQNNVRPKAFFVHPEAQYLRHMQDEGEGLT